MRLIGVWLSFILASLAAWHVTGDRSNAGGVVGSVAGVTGDEVFLSAQEAAQQQQQQRDSQGRLILAIFQLSPTPVTIGTRNWPNSLELGARLLREHLNVRIVFTVFTMMKCKFETNLLLVEYNTRVLL